MLALSPDSPGSPDRGPDQPIAIIGMGCRFAGDASSPEKYWALLAEGRDAISEVAEERWASYAAASAENAAALRTTTRFGGFLADIAGFDAEFFGVMPREAELMDPQQRIMLEVVWEALEHAGIPPTSLAGSDAGVFTGVGSDDYGRRLLEDLPRIEAWTGIGAAMCAVANRVSYALDLRGPSFAVDTACSASLVAVHLAAQALIRGETSLAIVGGVNVMAGPGLTMVLDAAGAISPDGRCKTFDATANGYGRGEGCGVVVLKRLADAQRDGDRVLAVIRGGAVRQDGRTNGIMAPSGEAQADVLRQAYHRAGLDPRTVDFVEAHGTGTRAGDPIEAGAMAAVFGAGRPAGEPCLIGSVKPNIGHLEAGSGVAGVIKAVLALGHGEIPPSLNFSEPNPAIPWDTAGLAVVAERTRWPVRPHPRRAGVSGYGYGGTIAHLVLEQAPEPAAGQDGPATARDGSGLGGGHHGGAPVDRLPAPALFPLSGATEAGLRANAARLADLLAEPDAPGMAALGHTLSARRTQLVERAGVVAADRAGLRARLLALANGDEPAGVVTGTRLPAARDMVWVFSGHGSQWLGMGRELLETEPEFAAALDELAPVFAEEIGFTPREALLRDPLTRVDVIQPLVFAMQVGLAAVWRRHGIRPAAVIGHSVGEIAAAVTVGALDLLDGARLICRRSILLRRVAGQGAMVLVDLPFAEVAEKLAGRDDVAAAISAAPGSTVVAGQPTAVERLVQEWTGCGRVVRRVASDVAFHSGQMDPLLEELAAAVGGITPRAPRLPIYTTALPDPRSNPVHDGAYWAANLRNPVRFSDAVSAAVADGYRVFVEVSSHPVVAHSISEVLSVAGVTDGFVTGTLRRDAPERETLLASLGALHCHGVPVDLAAQFPTRELADLPTYAWQHRRFWRESGRPAGEPARQHDTASHTLLGGRTDVAGSTAVRVWQTFLDESCRPYPGDHPVQNVEIIPAAVLLNTFITAARDAGGPAPAGPRMPALTDVALRVPVSVAAPRDLQVSYQDNVLRLASRPVGESSWLVHTVAAVEAPAARPAAEWVGGLDGGPDGRLDIERLRERCAERLAADFVIDRLAGVGVAAMGFPWLIEELRRDDGRELLAVVDPGGPAPAAGQAGVGSRDGAAPGWASALDAALSIASVVFAGPAMLRMPAAIDRVALAERCPERVLVSVRVVDGAASADTVDVRITDEDGRVVARLDRLRYGLLEGDPGANASPRRLVHEITWQPFDLSAASGPDALPSGTGLGTVALIGGEHPLSRAVAAGLAAGGIAHRVLDGPAALAALAGAAAVGSVLVVPRPPDPDEPTHQAALRAAWLLAETAQLLAARALGGPTLWAITAGVRESASAAALSQSPLWGVGRIVAGEHPELWGGIIDLDPDDPGTAGCLPEILRNRPVEDVIVLRGGADGGAASRSRLMPVEREQDGSPVGCRPDGTYLITGGLGTLGLAVARWLAGRGARRIILTGRRGLPPRTSWDAVTEPAERQGIAAVRALEALGVTVAVIAADVSDRGSFARAVDPAALGLPPIRGVVHAAGVLDNRRLVDLGRASLRTVMRAKTEGALVLHQMFPPGSLDFLVFFSSCGYLLGLPGQASYAAANAFLDGLAAHRRAAGAQDTVSFGWTSWRGLGMSTSSQLIDIELNARGTADITATEAFLAWEHAERYSGAHFAVLRMIPMDSALPRLPLLRDTPVAGEPVEADDGGGWTGLDPEELRGYLLAEVSRHVCNEIKTAPDDLDPRRPLAELGLDSVMTVVIRRRLEKTFRLALPPTLLWTHPTVTAIAGYLADQLLATGDAAEADQLPEMALA